MMPYTAVTTLQSCVHTHTVKYILLQRQVSELVTERDKLRGVVRKLKDDRTHYRTVAENTQ